MNQRSVKRSVNFVNAFTLLGLMIIAIGIILFALNVWGIGGLILYSLIGIIPISMSRFREYRLKPITVEISDNGVMMTFKKKSQIVVHYSDIRRLSLERPTTIGLRDDRHLYVKGKLYPYIISEGQAISIKNEFERWRQNPFSKSD